MKEAGSGVDNDALPIYALQEGQVGRGLGRDNKCSFGFIDIEMNVWSLELLTRQLDIPVLPDNAAVFSLIGVSPVPSS